MMIPYYSIHFYLQPFCEYWLQQILTVLFLANINSFIPSKNYLLFQYKTKFEQQTRLLEVPFFYKPAVNNSNPFVCHRQAGV